ncbi:MAG TPA: DUF427 domain-containing protein [Acidimicrobiales bacterium]|nr:DUF427 domain-containing protein [Acidimicrobiales bacterium]
MTDARPHLEPGPDHPITVTPFASKVTVSVGSQLVAATDRALELREASYPPVYYIPVEDVADAVLKDSEHHTYCPYKGEASYYDLVPADGDPVPAAVWYYPTPFPAGAPIAGHVAFYRHKVQISTD